MKRLDLTGKTFGKLTALSKAKSLDFGDSITHSTWLCVCECGKEVIVETQKLRSGHTQSCGCNRGIDWVPGRRFGKLVTVKNLGGRTWELLCDCGHKRIAHATNIHKLTSCGCSNKPNHNQTHGMTRTREYYAWYNAKKRCFWKKGSRYQDYGGRGITMCDEWKNSFEAFFSYMGKCPDGYQLDRINNDGNYEPGNCRWATRTTQSRNKQKTLYFNRRSIKDIAAERGINYYTLRAAYQRGENPITYIPLKR